MESNFWLNKWVHNEIGFHRNEYSANLEQFWGDFAKDKGAVFVPLCGKSLDMLFFNEKGHRVYGCELSPLAVEAFFKENKIPYEQKGHLYYTDELFIYCDDLFKLSSHHFHNVSYIYDRASMIALPTEMRAKYVAWIKDNFPGVPLFVDTIYFDNAEIGPPFSISKQQVEEAYADTYKIKLVNEVELPDGGGVHEGKISFCKALTFFISPK